MGPTTNITYSIILNGLQKNASEEKSRENLAALFKATPEQIENILNTPGFVLKNGLKEDIAQKYKKAIEMAGGICLLRCDDEQHQPIDVDLPTTSNKVKLQAASPSTKTPTFKVISDEFKKQSILNKISIIVIAPLMIYGLSARIYEYTYEIIQNQKTATSEAKIIDAAQQIIQQALKSPSSFSPVSSTIVWRGTYKNRNAYIVKTAFDAQNSFGANLRDCNYVAFSLAGEKISWNKLFSIESCNTPSMMSDKNFIDAMVISNFPEDQPPEPKPTHEGAPASKHNITNNNPEAAPNTDQAAITNELAMETIREWFTTNSSTQDGNDILPYYAQEVDYYAKGIVDKSYIEKDRSNFFKRWPIRRNTLGNISLEASPRPEEIRATIPFSWEVESSNSSKKGSSTIFLTLKIISGKFLISKESGG